MQSEDHQCNEEDEVALRERELNEVLEAIDAIRGSNLDSDDERTMGVFP